MKKYLMLLFIRVCLCISFSSFNWQAIAAPVDEYFNKISHSPQKLYAFFKNMPKGGELHYHFAGSAYPEELIKMINLSDYCLNLKTFTITTHKFCSGVLAKPFLMQRKNQEKAINMWSMQPVFTSYTARYNHFFNVFEKIIPIYNQFYGPLLAKMIMRAANQHELYMEIILPHLEDAKKYAKTIQNISDLSEKRLSLLANQSFQKSINKMVKDTDLYLGAAHKELNCNKSSKQAACKMVVRFQAFVARQDTIDEVFAEALAAFESALRSEKIVAVNLVQSENSIVSLRDFKKQMAIFAFLHKKYPNVRIALHAGEIDPKTNQLKDLCCHINDSVYIANADRIGHGTDIMHEKNNQDLLKYMHDKGIAVEINLSSSKLILAISGAEHPFLFYIKHGVPVVLSTDDEGILQTDLTRQYVEAVRTYHLNYQTIKQLNRNTLTYSFLPGKSIWLNPEKQTLVASCNNLTSNTCKNFIKTSEKARLQWELEVKLSEFETHVPQ